MTEAALGAETKNTSGALHVYESFGYRPVSRQRDLSRAARLTGHRGRLQAP